MERSLVRREVLPFLILFGTLVVLTVVSDALLHLFGLAWIGRYLGIPGVLLILFSFLYSMRKRKLIGFGRPQSLLTAHETLTWLGALMILVHAGIHVYAILPWLALVAMLVTVASGLTGKYLLNRSRRFLDAKKAYYTEQGLREPEIEKLLFWDATAYDLMKRWRAVHIPITLAFGVLGLTHILGILLFWQWR